MVSESHASAHCAACSLEHEKLLGMVRALHQATAPMPEVLTLLTKLVEDLRARVSRLEEAACRRASDEVS